MTHASVINTRNGRTLVNFARVALSYRERVTGLLGDFCLPAGEGLLIPGCQRVHTVGMRFGIDVVFIADDGMFPGWQDHGLVICLANNLGPGNQVVCTEAQSVLELPGGTIRDTATVIGDRLQLDYF